MLYATGLVAGGSLAGIAIALLMGFGKFGFELSFRKSLILLILWDVDLPRWLHVVSFRKSRVLWDVDLPRWLNVGHGYFDKLGLGGDLIGFGMFGVLCILLLRQARAKDA